MMIRAGFAVVVVGLGFGAIACTTSFETGPMDSTDAELSTSPDKKPAPAPTGTPSPSPSGTAPIQPPDGDFTELAGAWGSGTGAIATIVFEYTPDGSGHHYFDHPSAAQVSGAQRPEGYYTVKGDEVVLNPKGGSYHPYRFSVDKDVLTLNDGTTIQKLKKVDSYCDQAADCDAQGLVHIMCAGSFSCSKEQTCNFVCGSPAKPASSI